MSIKIKRVLLVSFAACIPSLVTSGNAFADRPAKEELRETVPVREPREVAPQPVPVASNACGNMRLSAGQTIWFFDDEDSTSAPGVYFDYWCADYPLNFRVGVEGRHMDVNQGNLAQFAEAPGEAVETTYIRIPFAVEYYTDVAEDLTWYAGIGPDIINMANDISDTGVGFHIGTRLHYAFTESWGAAVEGGYMWDYLEYEGEDVDLNGFYLTPQISYTF